MCLCILQANGDQKMGLKLWVYKVISIIFDLRSKYPLFGHPTKMLIKGSIVVFVVQNRHYYLSKNIEYRSILKWRHSG